MKTSDLKHIIKEALSEDESKAVLDKYKQRYAAVLKSNPDFIKKYPNPDKVIYGMAIKEITKLREKLGKKADVGDYKKDFRKSDAPQFKGKSKKKRDEMATAAFLSQQDKLKEGDLDVGHQDDEPRMIKKDIYNMGKYAMEIYKKLDRYDDMDNEVDFPHWWQSKLTKAKSMLQSAYDYLDGEEKLDQIDAIMEEDELTKSEKNKLKKVSSQLKKSVKAHDKQSKTIDKIVNEEEVKIGPHTFKKIKDDHYHKIDKNGNEKTGRKFRQQEIDYLMKTLKETGEDIAKTNMKKYKEGNMEENRLTELVKAALMGPISEKQAKPDFLDLDGDGDKEESMKQAAADKKKMEEESTPKYDDDPALKGKQSKLPDGLQKAIIKKKGGKIDETDMADRILDKTLNKVQDGENLLHKLIRKLKTLPNTSAQQIISQLKLEMTPAEVEALEEELRESFKSLSKDIDKQKGKTKEDGDNIAGYIANIKRKGGGKGPTKKMKKREGIKERILRELRGQ